MRRLPPILVLIAAASLACLTSFAAEPAPTGARTLPSASGSATEVTIEQARQQRHEAAHRPRRIVFHSDGVATNPAHAYHEPTPSVIPHLPTFKTMALGAKEATNEERAALTALLRRLRALRNERGTKTGKPLLLAVRTPDTLEYSRALWLDLEQWMKEKLIDVWITPGYFRLTEWEDIVKLAHRHDMPVWAATDESRVKDRDGKNSIEAYRARIMNMRRAGVDSVCIFNCFHFPKEAEFQLLKEAGSIDTLALTDKLHVADDLGPKHAGFYLANGLSYVGRPKYFAPAEPEMLQPGQSREIALRVGDDLKAAPPQGFTAAITMKLQATGVPEDLQIKLNGQALQRNAAQGEWLDYSVSSEWVKQGTNQIPLRRGSSIAGGVTLKDLQLSIRYRRASL